MGDARVIKRRGSVMVPDVPRAPRVEKPDFKQLPFRQPVEDFCVFASPYLMDSSSERVKWTFWVAPRCGDIVNLRFVAKDIPEIRWTIDLYVNDTLIGQTTMTDGAAFFALADAQYPDMFHVEPYQSLSVAAHADPEDRKALLLKSNEARNKGEEGPIVAPKWSACVFGFRPDAE